jgi:hypothetical protein
MLWSRGVLHCLSPVGTVDALVARRAALFEPSWYGFRFMENHKRFSFNPEMFLGLKQNQFRNRLANF